VIGGVEVTRHDDKNIKKSPTGCGKTPILKNQRVSSGVKTHFTGLSNVGAKAPTPKTMERSGNKGRQLVACRPC
jgi:hypothetical protein